MESPSTYFSGFNINDLLYLDEAALRTLWISFWAISIGSIIGIFLGLALSVSRFVAYTLGAVLDAELKNAAGEMQSRDRRYVEVSATQTLNPKPYR